MKASIKAIEYHLPEGVLTNEKLAAEFPDWTLDKIEGKTGIKQRHIAAPDECASDLGIKAAQKLFAAGACKPEDIDFLLLCTQSPDYFLPTTACVMQEKLGLPTTTGALDFNLGCSGYIYGLGLAKGMIETGQARRVLLITAETYSKFINAGDKSVRTIFGDAAAATLVEATDAASPRPEVMGPFVYGTDGKGAKNLIVPAGGVRKARTPADAEVKTDEHGNRRANENLYMNGPEIFTFTLESVPKLVAELLKRSGETLESINMVVFHQANQYMLEHLRKRIKIPPEKFLISMGDCGNTVSSTVPIALKNAMSDGRLQRGQRLMLVGFGVGYSWGACVVDWLA